MVFCGYNQTMADGLELFVEGMIEAMLTRHDSGLSMDEVLRTELRDLTSLNETLNGANRQVSDLLNALVAINSFAQTIFTRAKGEEIDAERFAGECRRSGQAFINLVRMTEERHLSELLNRGVGHGDVDAIKAVGGWLLQDIDFAGRVIKYEGDQSSARPSV